MDLLFGKKCMKIEFEEPSIIISEQMKESTTTSTDSLSAEDSVQSLEQ